MKNNLLLFSFFSISGLFYTQDKARLIKDFETQAQNDQAKFSKFLQNKTQRVSIETINQDKQNLAGFVGEIPIFWASDDMRANRSANVINLQSGTQPGVNSAIDGTGINILVMDGGRVLDRHNEFGGPTNGPNRVLDGENGTTSFGLHPTQVAGIIAASGVGNFSAPYGANGARGILPNATITSQSFQSTALGTNYTKLTNSTANISNHSYGINVGWNRITETSSTFPQVGFYWIANYSLNTRDTYNGAYNTQDQSFDRIVANDPDKIVIKSAGNYYGTHPDNDPSLPKFKFRNGSYVPFEPNDVIPEPNCSQGYNCIGFGSLAKNIIVVGATEQLTSTNNVYGSSADIVKASYSSAGPRKDGAIKPDISAVGSQMLSPGFNSSSQISNDSYYIGSGTSFSAPIISGIAGAVTQVNRIITGNNNFIFKADEMKALLTHTANEAGNPGPDVWFGWGFADASKAAQLVIDKKDKKAFFERKTLVIGGSFSQNVIAKSGEPLKATLSWIDPPATPFVDDIDLQNNNTSRIVNDLDLRIVDTTTNTVHFPWKLSISNPMANATKGDNTVDNVEQVLIENPVAGRTYRVEISHKGNLVDVDRLPSSQAYALIISGIDANSLSTENINSKPVVSIYPTKTSDFVNVLASKGNVSIEIFDMNGKKVTDMKSNGFVTINISNFVKGVYLIKVKSDNKEISQKIIKE